MFKRLDLLFLYCLILSIIVYLDLTSINAIFLSALLLLNERPYLYNTLIFLPVRPLFLGFAIMTFEFIHVDERASASLPLLSVSFLQMIYVWVKIAYIFLKDRSLSSYFLLCLTPHSFVKRLLSALLLLYLNIL